MTRKEQYEKDLKKRQADHINRINELNIQDWKPCIHDQCPDCLGTGIKVFGGLCVHSISCDCPKCRFR